MANTAIDFFLETLKQLITSSELDLIIQEKDKLESLKEEIQYLRRFLEDSEEKRQEHPEVQELVMQIRDAASEAENMVELFVVGAIMSAAGKFNQYAYYIDHLSLQLGSVEQEINRIVTQVREIYDKNLYGISVLKRASKSSAISGSSRGGLMGGGRTAAKQLKEEIVVGFDEEVNTLEKRLAGGARQLEIIPIVGKPGVGKTTLAWKVYNSGFIASCFGVRAWVTISREYQMRDLLIQILQSASLNDKEDTNLSDDRLAEELGRRLRGKKYLIVMDDIWSIQAWDDLKRSFPDESNGSKVIFTSRIPDVAKPAQPDSVSHGRLPFSGDEPWELLRKKVFGEEPCPRELEDIGREIAGKCGGLPLVIVVTAGHLAMGDKTPEAWEEVAKQLNSIIERNEEVIMETLEYSFNNLPLHLKACFAYLGGFPEDYEIPVRKLIWLWVAEGFVRQTGGFKSLEALAEDYLRDLVGRDLVNTVRERTSTGGIKTCRIHDVLREVCLRNAEEDNYSRQIYEYEQNSSPNPPPPQIYEYEQNSSSFPPPPTTNKHIRRLYITRQVFHEISLKPYARNLRSLLCFGVVKAQYEMFRGNTLFLLDHGFKLLRVLDLISISISWPETELERLVHLRYLALWATIRRLPPTISNLLNLETLILGTVSTVTLPLEDICKMAKLRHLYTKKGIFHVAKSLSRRPKPPVAATKMGSSSGSSSGPSSSKILELSNLQTLNQLCPCKSCQQFLERTPNLRKLGICGDLISASGDLTFPDLDCLSFLVTLKCINTSTYPRRFSSDTSEEPDTSGELNIPNSVQRLTLQNTRLTWDELSTLETLPNLEVLKLVDDACVGQVWNISEDGFSQLKYLRLRRLDLVEWNAYADDFPNLEVLVLQECQNLKEIPPCFANIKKLRTIEVNWCSHSTEDSALLIKEKNNKVNIIIRSTTVRR